MAADSTIIRKIDRHKTIIKKSAVSLALGRRRFSILAGCFPAPLARCSLCLMFCVSVWSENKTVERLNVVDKKIHNISAPLSAFFSGRHTGSNHSLAVR